MLKVCYNILNNYSCNCIPPSVFTPHLYPHLRHSHSKMVLRPNAKTNSHKYSFFIDVIPIWNSLPPDVINSPSPMCYSLCDSIYLCFVDLALSVLLQGTHWTEHANQTGDKLKDYYSQQESTGSHSTTTKTLFILQKEQSCGQRKGTIGGGAKYI